MPEAVHTRRLRRVARLRRAAKPRAAHMMQFHLLPHPSPTLTLFAWLVDHLRAFIGPHTTAYTQVGRFALFLHDYVLRTSLRLDALFAKWRAGTLPPPRARKPRKTPSRRPEFRLPQGKLWLVKRIPGTGFVCESLGKIHQDEEFQQFLREVPRAVRLLRPFYTGSDFTPPGTPPKPPRLRTPRPRQPKPTPPPRPKLRYPLGEIPARLRLRVPKLRRSKASP